MDTRLIRKAEEPACETSLHADRHNRVDAIGQCGKPDRRSLDVLDERFENLDRRRKLPPPEVCSATCLKRPEAELWQTQLCGDVRHSIERPLHLVGLGADELREPEHTENLEELVGIAHRLAEGEGTLGVAPHLRRGVAARHVERHAQQRTKLELLLCGAEGCRAAVRADRERAPRR